MSDTDKEVNEYGMTPEEYDTERKAARAAVRGEAPPEVEVKVEEEQPAEIAPAKTEVETQEEDPLAFVPEEHREKIASILKSEREKANAAEHRLKSDVGRVDAYQRKYEEARREKAELEALLAAQSKAPKKSLQELSPRFKEMAEIGDESLETFEELRERLRAEMREEMEDRIKAATAPLIERDQQESQRHQEQAQAEFNRTLDEKVGNWREIVYAFDENGKIKVDDKNVPIFSDAWATFIQDQPTAFQSAYRNPTGPDDALRAFEDYSRWGTKKGLFEEETPVADAKIPNADAIQTKRNNDLKKATPPKAGAVPLQVSQSENWDDPATEARLRKLAREAIRKGDPSIFNRK